MLSFRMALSFNFLGMSLGSNYKGQEWNSNGTQLHHVVVLFAEDV